MLYPGDQANELSVHEEPFQRTYNEYPMIGNLNLQPGPVQGSIKTEAIDSLANSQSRWDLGEF
jgi:hypothetical protein